MKQFKLLLLFLIIPFFALSQENNESGNFYYPNGQVKGTCSSNGEVRLYYQSGQLSFTGTIMDNRNKQLIDTMEALTILTTNNANSKSPFEIENIRMERKEADFLVLNDSDSWNTYPYKYLWNSTVKLYFPSGSVSAIADFKKGVPQKNFQSILAENGQIKEKIVYLNVNESVDSIWFNDTGKLKKVERYLNGKKSGIELRYYTSGNLNYKKQYLNGLENGEQIGYYETGELYWKFQYKMGKEDGDSFKYYENGRVKTKSTYKDGKKIGVTLEYNEDGKLLK